MGLTTNRQPTADQMAGPLADRGSHAVGVAYPRHSVPPDGKFHNLREGFHVRRRFCIMPQGYLHSA